MGTEIEIFIPLSEGKKIEAQRNAHKVFHEFNRLEKIFSRFDADSQLSSVNTQRKKRVSPEFFEVLEFALQLAQKTDGVFNPLISLASLGYSTDFYSGKFSKKFPKKGQHISLDYEAIQRDKQLREISLPPHAFLDLGGCVKGYAVDRGVKILDTSYNNFCINAGGDIFARGRFSSLEKWSIGIADPSDFTNEEKNIFWIEIEDQALATSGSYKRRWNITENNQEKCFHHLVSGKNNKNPSSQENPLQSVSIIADTCIEADSFATTCFLLGEEQGRNFCIEENVMGYFA